MIWINETNTWKCLSCQKEFKRKDGVKIHIEGSHFDNNPEQCYLCLKWYKNKFSLRAHMRGHKIAQK